MYNKYDSKEQPIADELAINNMLIALEYSEKYSNIFSVEEESYLKNAIRAHVLMNANKVYQLLDSIEDKKSLPNKTKIR